MRRLFHCAPLVVSLVCLLAGGTGAVPAYKYRIIVNAEGVYRLTGTRLRDAGISLDVLGANFSTIRLYNKDREIPLYISGEQDGRFDAEDYIEFYGTENRQTFQSVSEGMYRDPFTSENVYMLTWGGQAGARIVEEDGSIIETDRTKLKMPEQYRYTIHLEEDQLFYRLGGHPSRGLRDHWFWDQILSGPSQGGKKIYTVDLPLPSKYDQNVRYRVMLQGYGEVAQHQASVWFNDAKVGNVAWPGETGVVLTDSITSSILVQDGNRLEIACETPSDLDAILFNWIEIDYDRQYRAEGNAIKFAKPPSWQNGLYEFVLDGFTDPDIVVYKDDKSRIRFGDVTSYASGGETYYTLRFQDEIFSAQTQYYAFNRNGVRTPVRIEPYSDGGLAGITVGAEYLIITHSSLYDKASELAQYRQTQSGMSALVVKVGDIYNVFNHGIMSPFAIKDFLAQARQTWQTAPEYVVLVGDGAWDYDNYYQKGANLVPVYLEYTETWGVTASDNWYVCLEGDDFIPDMRIGRIPARNTTELGRVIDKIEKYETGSVFGNWRRDLLMIAGIGNPAKTYEPDNLYRLQAEKTIQNDLPAGYDVSRVYVWEDTSLAVDPYFGGTAELLKQFADGTAVTTFIGHGGGMVWSDRGLFTLDDVANMNNADRLPFILSATCFTSAFDDPRYMCLGEAMLLAKDNGCIAFWGASGLGYTYEDIKYFGHIYRAMFDAGHRRLGDIISTAKKTYFEGINASLRDTTGAGWALVNQYNLLGDPAVTLRLPDYPVTPVLSASSYSNGDTLRLTASLPEALTGTLSVRIVSDDHLYDTLFQSIHTGQSVSSSFKIPTDMPSGEFTAALYLSDPDRQKDAVGQAGFSAGASHFVATRLSPEEISWQDSVYGACQVTAPDSVLSVELCWRRERDSVFNIIAMADSGTAGWYTALHAIPPDSCDSVTFYYFVAVDAGGTRDSTDSVRYKVSLKPDLSVSVNEVYIAGFDTVRFNAVIRNLYDRPPQLATRSTPMPAESVWVTISLDAVFLDSVLIPELVWNRPETVSVPVTLANGNYTFRVAVDPGRTIPEDLNDTTNNAASLTYQVNLFTVVAGSVLDARTVDGQFGLAVPAAGTVHGGVLRLDLAEDNDIGDQPGFKYLKTPANRNAVYRITGSDALSLGGAFTISHRLDTTLYGIDTVGMFRWDENTDNWIRVPGQYLVSGNEVAVNCSSLGTFALMAYADKTGPVIEVNVEDQRFSDGSYVSGAPVVVALFQDVNGIDTGSGIEVYFDGNKVDHTDYAVPDGKNPNIVPVTFQPKDLDYGSHHISFKASDCAGNTMATEDLAMVLAEELAIKYAGTYPSPFVRETEFAFLVTQQADVSIKIYSASGRMVRKIDDIYDWDAAGLYHTTWDGSDREGNQVANGVYYYKITAANSSGTATYRGKVARYR